MAEIEEVCPWCGSAKVEGTNTSYYCGTDLIGKNIVGGGPLNCNEPIRGDECKRRERRQERKRKLGRS